MLSTEPYTTALPGLPDELVTGGSSTDAPPAASAITDSAVSGILSATIEVTAADVVSATDADEVLGPFGPALLPDRCDRLTLIEGIEIDTARLLAACHVTRFADIAAFTAEDLADVGELLADSDRITRQMWIEQATLLARGIDTPYSRSIMGEVPTELSRAPLAQPIRDPFVPGSNVIPFAPRQATRSARHTRLRRSAGYLTSALAGAAAAFVMLALPSNLFSLTGFSIDRLALPGVDWNGVWNTDPQAQHSGAMPSTDFSRADIELARLPSR